MNKFDELAKLFENKQTAEELLAMSLEEAKDYLDAKGLIFTTEELVTFADGVKSGANSSEDELSESDVEAVAGGSGYTDQCYNVGYKCGQVLRGLFNWGIKKVSGLW